jgi:hypothetical protein
MPSHAPNALRVLRNDEIVDVVRHALRRGGLHSTKEPGLAILQPRALGPRPPAGARGDLLFSLEGQQCVCWRLWVIVCMMLKGGSIRGIRG